MDFTALIAEIHNLSVAASLELIGFLRKDVPPIPYLRPVPSFDAALVPFTLGGTGRIHKVVAAL